MDFTKDIADQNRNKFFSGPTITQIEEAIRPYKISEYQFERAMGIPKGTIKCVRAGHRPMPAKFWHLFLENTTQHIKKPTVKRAVSISVSEPTDKKKLANSRLNHLLT